MLYTFLTIKGTSKCNTLTKEEGRNMFEWGEMRALLVWCENESKEETQAHLQHSKGELCLPLGGQG